MGLGDWLKSSDRGFLFPVDCPYEPGDDGFDEWVENKLTENWRRYLRREHKLDSNETKKLRYRRYLSNPAWKERAKRAKRKAGFKCQKCGSRKNLHVHHKTYDNLGCERDEDLTVLCKKCHFAEHRKKGQ